MVRHIQVEVDAEVETGTETETETGIKMVLAWQGLGGLTTLDPLTP